MRQLCILVCLLSHAHASCAPGLSPSGGGMCTACAAGTHKRISGGTTCSQCQAGKFSGTTEDRLDASVLQGWVDEGITRWVRGDAGSSCDDACAAIDSHCLDPVNNTDARKMTLTVTTAIFTATGANCHTRRPSADAPAPTVVPYSEGTTCYDADERALCSLAHGSAARLCACNASKTQAFQFAPAAGIYSGASECIDCAAGTRSVAGSAFCAAPCVAGRYHASYAGFLACEACDSGKFSDAGATACRACAAGTYSGSAGATACVACAADMRQAAVGSVACVPCEDGFTSVVGSVVCVPRAVCPGGNESMFAAVAAVLRMPCSVDAMLSALLVPCTRLLSGPPMDVLQSFVVYYASQPAAAMPKTCTDVYIDVVRKLQDGTEAPQAATLDNTLAASPPATADRRPATLHNSAGDGQCAHPQFQLAAAFAVCLLHIIPFFL